MSTNSRRKKAKNPKVQALIDAIDKYVKAKERYLELKTEMDEAEDKRYRHFLQDIDTAQGFTPEKKREIDRQMQESDARVMQQVAERGFMKSKPLPLP